ncbi:MAG: lantibiotic dehydratase [Oenococcus oeni]
MIAPMNIYRHTNYPIELVLPFRNDTILKKFKKLTANRQLLENQKQEIFDYVSKNELNFDDLRRIMRKIKKNKEVTLAIPDDNFEQLCRQYNDFLKKEEVNLKEYTNLVATIAQKERVYLKKVYSNSKIANSLIFTIGGSVENKLEDYTKKKVTEHTKNLRKLDRLLIEYLTRATLKTSPLADMTRTTIITAKSENKQPLGTITINNFFLIELMNRVIENNEFICNLQYRTNKTTVVQEKQIFATIPATVSLDKNKNYLINNSQGLKKIVFNPKIWSFLEQSKEWSSYQQLVSNFEKKFSLSPQQSEQGIKTLIKNGFLVRKSIIDTSNSNFIKKLEMFLKEKNIEPNLQHTLNEIIDVSNYINKSNELDSVRLLSIKKLLRQIETEYRLTSLPEKNLVYVDFVGGSARNPIQLNAQSDNFKALQTLSLLFDSAFRSRVEVSEIVKNKFGKSVHMEDAKERSEVFRFLGSELTESNQTEIYSGTYDWNTVEQNKKINEMNEKVQLLFQVIEQNSNEHQLQISTDLLAKLSEPTKNILEKEVLSHSLFVQQDQKDELVVNHLYRGFTSFISRFSKDFSKDDDYKRYVNKYFNNVFEFPYSYGFNANLHQHYLANTIKLPYDSAGDSGIGWEDLSISIDDQTSLLSFKYEGKDVLPLFIGSLIKMLCPPIQNIMDLMCSHGAMYFDLSDIFLHHQLMTQRIQEAHVPRLYIQNGTNKLVISREKWLLSSESLSKESLSDIEYQQKLFVFFQKQQIPSKFFAKGFNQDASKLKGNSMKPQYINLSSPMLLKTFLHIIQMNEFVSLEEEFPINADKGTFCEEYIIENTYGGGKNDSL